MNPGAQKTLKTPSSFVVVAMVSLAWKTIVRINGSGLFCLSTTFPIKVDCAKEKLENKQHNNTKKILIHENMPFKRLKFKISI